MLEDFGEWLPDLPALGNPGCTECSNLLPISGGYRGISVPNQASSTGLTARCRGAYNGIFGGSSVLFAGDATKLYSLTSYNGAWNDDSGTTYAAGNNWRFTQFGSLVIAVNGGTSSNDAPQVWDMSSDVPGTDNWGNLGGSPPKAACCTVIGQFVVMGHTYDATDGEVEDRVRWSGYANAASWAVDPATQSDFEDLNTGGGAVVALTGGAKQGRIYQERAISLMRYTGPAPIFEIDKDVYGGLGTPSGMSVVDANGDDYLWSTIGFISISPSGQITPIGSQKVDRYFASQLSSGDEETIVGCHDPARDSVVWLYGADTTSDTTTAIAYNYKLGQWYEMVFSLQDTRLVLSEAQFITPAKLGTQVEQTLYVFVGDTTSPNYGVYALDDDSDSLVGRLTTREYQFTPNRKSLLKRFQIMSDTGTSYGRLANIKYRNTQATETLTSVACTEHSGSKEMQTIVNARYHRINVVMYAQDLKIAGIDIIDVSPGARF